MRCALVSGATGFVGGELVRALRTAGWTVHAIVRPTSDPVVVAGLQDARCTVHVHDGSLASLLRTVGAAAPVCTWHLATRFVGEHAGKDVVPLVRDNVEFGTLLFEALASTPHPAVVTAGSHWQQFDNAPYSPLSLYAATKQAFDAVAAYYTEVGGFRVVECLLTDTYGPSDRRHKLLWQLREAARTGMPLAMSGDGSQYIDLLHVDDAVRALVSAADRATDATAGTSERWAVRPHAAITVRELVEHYGRAIGRAVPVEWFARPRRPREMHVPWTAGEVLPGWTPIVGLDDGLRSLSSSDHQGA